MEKVTLLKDRMSTLLNKVEDRVLRNELQILLAEFQLETEKTIKEVTKQCKKQAQAQK